MLTQQFYEVVDHFMYMYEQGKREESWHEKGATVLDLVDLALIHLLSNVITTQTLSNYSNRVSNGAS